MTVRRRYSAFSLSVDSDVELPGLPELAVFSGAADVTIRLGSLTGQQRPATIDDHLACPAEIGRIRITRGARIVVDPAPNTDTGTLRTLLLGRIMAHLLRQRGYLAIHASAVSIAGRAVLFAGRSGSGKSTTAAAFHARGYDVLADDVAPLRTTATGVELQGAWAGLRLLDDSLQVLGQRGEPAAFQADKHVVRLQGCVPARPLPVSRIYFLRREPVSGIGLHRLSSLEQVALLHANSFAGRRTGAALRQINLDRCAAVAAAGLGRSLTRKESLGALPALVDFVQDDLRNDD